MKKMTDFWQRYVAGDLTCLAKFKAAVAKERDQAAPDNSFDRFMGYYDEGPMWVAPSNLRNPPRIASEALLRQHARADWQQVDPRVRRFAAVLIEAARKQNIPLYVHTAFRSPEMQTEMFKKGRSKARPPVAAHVRGAAVDIVHSNFHWEMSKSEWAYIGKLGLDIASRLNLPIEWGGTWSFYDPAHWELKQWKNNVRPVEVRQAETYTPRKLLKMM